MLLIRLIFSAMLAVSTFSSPTFANAAEKLLAVHPEETLALNSPITDTAAPTFLPSARDIKIELLPLSPTTTAAQKSATSDPVTQDLWTRIRNGFAMQGLDSKLVTKHEKWYANHPDYVERMADRARRYLYFIAEEVERRGMPSEIALLPMHVSCRWRRE